MKKPVLLLHAGSLATLSFGQGAQIVFNCTAFGQPYMVWNQSPITTAGAYYNAGAYLVIDNANTNALWYQPTSSATIPPAIGIMRTEAAQNKIRWASGATNGVFSIPYANQANAPMPLLIEKLAGAGAGSFVLSTYSYYAYQVARPWGGPVAAGNEWNNTLYIADAGVTHMNDYTTGLPNNSDNVVDRFWIIDPQEANAGLWTNYGTAPTVELDITHANGDVQPFNTFTPTVTTTPLRAQRFNTTLNKWGDVLFDLPGVVWSNSGSAGTVANTPVSGANFFATWTLSTQANPLPIELTEWTGVCVGDKVDLTWTTATEHNNDYFTIEKSKDAEAWEEIGEVDAVGNSLSSTSYSFYDANTDGLAYYRLSQTDIDGQSEVFGVVAAGCSASNTEIVTSWDDGANLQITVSSTDAGIYDLLLTDAQGKVLVNRPSQVINKGFTPLSVNKAGIATGVYVVTLQNTNDVMTRRVVLH